ncbi:hypothetical protein Sjap_008916 [Stephania japonica]|uniref:Uncharacterized protein n=1 Tax=Stephania japonica TaxID=461633 RepID=A0AAP0PBU1_9MAGN
MVGLASRWTAVGRTLLGGIGNGSSGLLKSPHKLLGSFSCGSFLSQQRRTFIQMRTNLKVVDNSGAKRVMAYRL